MIAMMSICSPFCGFSCKIRAGPRLYFIESSQAHFLVVEMLALISMATHSYVHAIAIYPFISQHYKTNIKDSGHHIVHSETWPLPVAMASERAKIREELRSKITRGEDRFGI